MTSIFRVFLVLTAVAVMLPLCMGLLAPLHPLFDSFGHFRVHGIAATALVALGLALARMWRLAFSGAALAVAAAATLGPALPWPEAEGQGRPLTLVQFNMLFKNETPLKAADLIRAEAAHVVTLQEVSPHTRVLMDALAAEYPAQHLCRFKAVGGAAILSRLPMSASGCGETYAWMRVGSGAEALTVVSMHLGWPYPRGQWRQVARVGPKLAELPKPILIGGDFNAAPWSHSVNVLSMASGTRAARGLRFTWGFGHRGEGPLPLMPIDHVLLPPELPAREVFVGPAAGSDHLPVIARLNWVEPSAAKDVSVSGLE